MIAQTMDIEPYTSLWLHKTIDPESYKIHNTSTLPNSWSPSLQQGSLKTLSKLATSITNSIPQAY